MSTVRQEPTIALPVHDQTGLPLTYDVAYLFPHQGEWTEADYWALPERQRIIELAEGRLCIPPMPTDSHQRIVGNLYAILRAFFQQHDLGRVRIAPLPVRLWQGKIREPDVIVMLNTHLDRVDIHGRFWEPTDLIIEVLSPGTAETDRVTKMDEYAQAAIPEYWIVVPQNQPIEIYKLLDTTYRQIATYTNTDQIQTPLLPGFSLHVAEIFSE